MFYDIAHEKIITMRELYEEFKQAEYNSFLYFYHGFLFDTIAEQNDINITGYTKKEIYHILDKLYTMIARKNRP